MAGELTGSVRARPAPTLGVLGLGLIGGSVAQAWAAQGGRVVAWSRSEHTRELAAAHPGLSVVSSPAAVVAGLGPDDIVLIATPLGALDATLDDVAAALADRPDPPTVTDAGSVKQAVTDHAGKVLADPSIFVPGHPMAGTEHSGFAHADPGLFDAARWALGVDEPVDLDRWASVARFVQALGAVVVPVNTLEHDRAVALVSHLPHVLAAGLTGLLQDETSGLARGLAAGSFASATRVVGGSGMMLGAELCGANRREVRTRLAELRGWLDSFDRTLELGSQDSIDEIFEAGSDGGNTSTQPEPVASVGLDREELLAIGRMGSGLGPSPTIDRFRVIG